MTAILLVCPEPLGHGRPAGVGIRFLEFSSVLQRAGFEVVVLSPDGGAAGNARTGLLTARSILDASRSAAAAVVQGHAANDFFAHSAGLPTVVDLYDPFIVENLNYAPWRGKEVYDHDRATLLASLSRGDLFLCASEAQRLFWVGMMMAAGRFDPVSYAGDRQLQQLIRIVPFGVPPPRPAASRDPQRAAILFGGIYDWYDPLLAIEATALLRRRFPEATLTFNQHPNPATTPQGQAAAALRQAKEKNYPWVRFEPWAPYAERGAFYDRFSAALLTFPRSLETDLAMRTRIFDDLWAGLPVVTSSAAGTDQIIRRYDCGEVVEGSDPEAYAAALERLLSSPERYQSSVRGAEEYVRSHGWDTLAAPLVDFCRHPEKHPASQSAREVSIPATGTGLVSRIKRRMGRGR